MKNVLKSLGALAVLIGVAFSLQAACGPTDMFCYQSGPYGGTATTVGQLTSGGNLIINGAATLGGALTTAGASTSTITGPLNVQKYLVPTSSVVYISAAGTQITPLTSYVVLGASMVAVGLPLTGTPTISTATVLGGQMQFADGQYLVVSGTSSATSIVLQDNGTLSGSRLFLGNSQNGNPLTFTVVSSTLTRTFVYNAYNASWNMIH